MPSSATLASQDSSGGTTASSWLPPLPLARAPSRGAMGPPKASQADLPLLGAFAAGAGAAPGGGAGAAEGLLPGGGGAGGAAAGEWRFSFARFARFVGPGLLMSIAYVDPGNLESDLQGARPKLGGVWDGAAGGPGLSGWCSTQYNNTTSTHTTQRKQHPSQPPATVGAHSGYRLLWVLLWSTALGFVLQMQAAKLGVVTRRNLAQHCRARLDRAPRLLLWLMAEVAIVGADVQEVIGSAIAVMLLTRGAVPLWAGVLLSAAASFLLLLIERLGVRRLEATFAALIAAMVAAFAHMYRVARVPPAEVLRGFLVPDLGPGGAGVGQAVALLGSLIMPANLYLHSALVQTRKLRAPDAAHRREALAYFGLESLLALAVSVLINACVVCVFAAGYYGPRAVGGEADDIGLENAGQYLGRTFGSGIVYIWVSLGVFCGAQRWLNAGG